MVVVEVGSVVRHQVVAAERLGNEHPERVREVPAGLQEELHRVVDAGGVRLVRVVDHRQHRLQLRAERRMVEVGLAGTHPVDVSSDGVELAVVDDVAVRVCEMPRAERVRREARVNQRDVAPEPPVGQVGVVRLELGALQQPLVDDALPVERTDVEPPGAVDVSDGRLDLAAGGVQRPVEAEQCRVGFERLGRRIGEPLGEARPFDGSDEHLRDVGLGVERGRAEVVVVRGHRPPGEHFETVHREHLRDDVVNFGLNARLRRHEHGADGVLFGKVGVDNLFEERVRTRYHDPGAVAGVLLGAGRPAVF